MEHDLIDAYTDALRRSLFWRRDVEEVVDEVADHLRENVARLVVAGVGEDLAQRRTLECFGELGLVARAFTQTPSGELAVPSGVTRTAGAVGVAAAAAWIWAAVAAATGGHTELFTTWTPNRYHLFQASVVVAVGLTALTLAGVLARAGALRRPAGVTLLVVAGVVTALLSVWTWMVTALLAPLGIAILVASGGLAIPDRLVRHLWVLGSVWPVATVALVVGDEIYPVGPVDDYGDYPVAWLLSFIVGAACSAAALIVIGGRLRSERPANRSHTSFPRSDGIDAHVVRSLIEVAPPPPATSCS